MAARRANKPYDVPSACGPGGLVSMLKNLRQLRDIDSEIDASNDSASNMDDTYITCRGIGDESKEHEKILMDINGKTGHKRIENADKYDSYINASELEKKIIRQVEYYFGDYNLPKDKWMLDKLEECFEDWFDMETMMTFKRLSGLTQDPSVVLTALSKSPRDLLQIENWGGGKGRVRRNPEYPIPELSEARRLSIQDRTLFVWGFDKTTTSLDDLIDYFEGKFRNVVNIRQRTMPVHDREESDMMEKEPKREFMGSVFVTFGSRQDAEEFFQDRHRHLIFRGRKLQAKWQRDFLQSRAEFNDEFDEEAIEKTVYVSGFDKLDTSKDELKRFFERFQGPIAVRKRVFRFGSSDNQWQFTGGVFVTFDTRKNAQDFLSRHGHCLDFNGDTFQAKWQKDFYREKGLFKKKIDALGNRSEEN